MFTAIEDEKSWPHRWLAWLKLHVRTYTTCSSARSQILFLQSPFPFQTAKLATYTIWTYICTVQYSHLKQLSTDCLTLVDTPMPDLMMSAKRGTSFSMTCPSMCGMQNLTASINGDDFEEDTLIWSNWSEIEKEGQGWDGCQQYRRVGEEWRKMESGKGRGW